MRRSGATHWFEMCVGERGMRLPGKDRRDLGQCVHPCRRAVRPASGSECDGPREVTFPTLCVLPQLIRINDAKGDDVHASLERVFCQHSLQFWVGLTSKDCCFPGIAVHFRLQGIGDGCSESQ